MTVIRSDVLGCCFGVRHALDAAERALSDNPGKKVYTLGPLIHNRLALEALEKKGLSVLGENDAEKAESGSVVIIRAHGVPPETFEALRSRNCTVVNATCIRVTESQKLVADAAQKGCTVLFAGDEKHGEVEGIAGYAKERFVLVQNAEEAEALPLSENAKALLLSQTTFSKTEFEKIAELLKRKCPSLAVINTICPATKARQDALLRLCPKVDGVLVVGGKNSANTKRLLLAARSVSCRADLIETADEIPIDYFKMERVGITAGASTVDYIIDEVEEALMERKDV